MFLWGRPPWPEELRRKLGEPAWPQRLASSPRSRVWRARLDPAPATGRDVVIKQVTSGRDARARFEREVTALLRAGRAGSPVVPSLLAFDDEARVLVMPFAGHHPRPQTWVVEHATALARLHVTGIGVEPDPDRAPLPGWSPPGHEDVTAFLLLAEDLSARIPRAAPAELDALVSRLKRVRRSALLHGDPCPGNLRFTPDGVRYIDLEQACMGPGLAELAYLRMGFPTCWCATTVPGRQLERAERAYHDTWQALAGYPPPGDLTDACTGWLLRSDTLVEQARRTGTDHFARARRQDWFWGTATARQRIAHRLRAVRGLTADRPDLAAVHDLTDAMLARIHVRWPHLAPLPSSQRAW